MGREEEGRPKVSVLGALTGEGTVEGVPEGAGRALSEGQEPPAQAAGLGCWRECWWRGAAAAGRGDQRSRRWGVSEGMRVLPAGAAPATGDSWEDFRVGSVPRDASAGQGQGGGGGRGQRSSLGQQAAAAAFKRGGGGGGRLAPGSPAHAPPMHTLTWHAVLQRAGRGRAGLLAAGGARVEAGAQAQLAGAGQAAGTAQQQQGDQGGGAAHAGRAGAGCDWERAGGSVEGGEGAEAGGRAE